MRKSTFMIADSTRLHVMARKSASRLRGTVTIAGDKSISHRALILGALAIGKTTIRGLLEADDILATARALQNLGTDIRRIDAGVWDIYGVGVGNFRASDTPLDLGNSGTGCRLLMGAVASSPINVTFSGDASLSRRPMARILNPLKDMGVHAPLTDKDTLPLTLTGLSPVLPLTYISPIASAQVKSAILLAGLGALGETSVSEAHPSRDHTERMLRLFGVQVTEAKNAKGTTIAINGEAQLTACDIDVPGDPSSAAFLIVAALLVPGSHITIQNVMLNPHRDGLIHALRAMGGHIEVNNQRHAAGETVADLTVCHSPLQGIELDGTYVPAMIDEYPILSIAAAYAHGDSYFSGLSELRVKESDRLHAIAEGLQKNGVQVKTEQDALFIKGMGGIIPGGGHITTYHDHRIAMSFLIAGLVAQNEIYIDDAAMIATSFPDFFDLMRRIGADFSGI